MKFQRNTKRCVMAETEVAPEAMELLFEATDVAELVAEVTGEPVDVTAEGESVTFTVGEEDYTVTAEGEEETVESSTQIKRNKRSVAASSRPLACGTQQRAKHVYAGRTVRKYPTKRR